MKNLKDKDNYLIPKALTFILAFLFFGALIATTAITTKSARPVLPVTEGGTGTSTIPSIGQLLIGNGTDYSLSTLIPGAGISIFSSPGSVRIENSGVLSLAGTPNQVNVSSATGTITLSLPQSVATSSSPAFSGLTLGNRGITFTDGTNQTSAADKMPAGTVISYAGTSTPTGWLLADGSAVSRTTYSDLFAAIGTTYGAGDGSTTFNLPIPQESFFFTPPPDIQPDLVLNWKMNETSGSDIIDSSGSNNNGTAIGTTIVTGKFGNARSFNGTSDYAVSINNIGVVGLAPWSITAWIKYNGAQTGSNNLVSIGQYGIAAQVFGLGTHTDSHSLFFNLWDSVNNTLIDTGKDLGAKFYSVIVTYDGNTIRLYLDGVLIGSKGYALNIVDNPARIGGQTGGYTATSLYFNGTIDEVRIYNRALSQAEINLRTTHLIKY